MRTSLLALALFAFLATSANAQHDEPTCSLAYNPATEFIEDSLTGLKATGNPDKFYIATLTGVGDEQVDYNPLGSTTWTALFRDQGAGEYTAHLYTTIDNMKGPAKVVTLATTCTLTKGEPQ